jgi:hypothetical protein
MGSSMASSMASSKNDTSKIAGAAGATGAGLAGAAGPAGPAGATGATGAAGAAGALAMKKPTAGGSEGFNLLETEREGFNKKSSTIPVTKPVGVDDFEAFSGSYNQQYSAF